MKIPKYMYEPVPAINNYGLRMACRALEIESALYSKGGMKEAALAMANSAKMLKRVTEGMTFADAFDFPWHSPLGKTEGNK